MNYTIDSAAQFCGPACWDLHSFSGLLRAGFSASALISLPHYRLGSTSSAVHQTQNLLSSARKETRPISRSPANIAPQGLAPMAERRFSNQVSHFPETKWR
jgi:hypothetical protein